MFACIWQRCTLSAYSCLVWNEEDTTRLSSVNVVINITDARSQLSSFRIQRFKVLFWDFASNFRQRPSTAALSLVIRRKWNELRKSCMPPSQWTDSHCISQMTIKVVHGFIKHHHQSMAKTWGSHLSGPEDYTTPCFLLQVFMWRNLEKWFTPLQARF